MEAKNFAVEEICRDVARLRIGFVNVFFVATPGVPGEPARRPWTLIDAGPARGAAQILTVAADRFGADSRPSAIVLTHGHFDHAGALDALLHVWDVPVYAHTLELPFLTGRADYPPPDTTVGGGSLRLAPLFPERGIDLGNHVRALPPNGTIPGMPGWQWIHTPGHAPGQVSLFRESDRVLLAGDAVTTTEQEAVFSALTQKPELGGPPVSFTIDWDKARRSVTALALLQPEILAAGHGEPMRGPALATDLMTLAHDFDRRIRPKHGRYVTQPASTDEHGVVALPPPARSGGVRWGALSGVAAGAFAATWLYRRFGRRSTS